MWHWYTSLSRSDAGICNCQRYATGAHCFHEVILVYTTIVKVQYWCTLLSWGDTGVHNYCQGAISGVHNYCQGAISGVHYCQEVILVYSTIVKVQYGCTLQSGCDTGILHCQDMMLVYATVKDMILVHTTFMRWYWCTQLLSRCNTGAHYCQEVVLVYTTIVKVQYWCTLLSRGDTGVYNYCQGAILSRGGTGIHNYCQGAILVHTTVKRWYWCTQLLSRCNTGVLYCQDVTWLFLQTLSKYGPSGHVITGDCPSSKRNLCVISFIKVPSTVDHRIGIITLKFWWRPWRTTQENG